ncbi:MAG: tRNA (adenosine(37)-N6)-threonylcarbamoyltransferase complex dimerization subunit type 1 TsaB [Candidatus Dadabacteria bacterium]|nr:MAG: tRNA (adenosine(37)-N6)-threonylcarbamoyltransferase complex dimerization subunit type 1 TsaB [Candidatus Dadabacteria bacterium]
MRAVLGIDTADRTAGVAVVVEGALACEVVVATGPRQSRRLTALIEEALAEAGVRRDELAAVAVTAGPGGFTGVRVGVAAAKGLALALGIPVVGVSTLEALAGRMGPWPGVVAPVLDAKKRQVYAGAWDGLTGEPLVPPAAWDPGAFARAVADLGRPAVFLGGGVTPYREVFREALGERYHEAPPEHGTVPPGRVALLGWARWQRGEAVPPETLVPTYLRRSEAEEREAGRRGS